MKLFESKRLRLKEALASDAYLDFTTLHSFIDLQIKYFNSLSILTKALENDLATIVHLLTAKIGETINKWNVTSFEVKNEEDGIHLLILLDKDLTATIDENSKGTINYKGEDYLYRCVGKEIDLKVENRV